AAGTRRSARSAGAAPAAGWPSAWSTDRNPRPGSRSRTTGAANPSLRSPLGPLLLLLARHAQPRIGHRLEPAARDRQAARLADSILPAIQPAQRLVDLHQRAALGGREHERLLALHRIGTRIRHVERVARQVTRAFPL